MPTPDPILAELRTLRLMLNIRHDDIAKLAHVSACSVSYWECGHRSPHLDKLRPYAAAVGYDLALVPLDPDSEAGEALSSTIRAAVAERDRAVAERDRLARAIAGLMSLTPDAVAAAYGVGYAPEVLAAVAGQVVPYREQVVTGDNLEALGRALDAIAGSRPVVDVELPGVSR